MKYSYPMTNEILLRAFDDPVEYMTESVLRVLRRKSGKPVRHQQTCPVCGRTIVNTYLKNGEWKCKRCLDKEDKHGTETD